MAAGTVMLFAAASADAQRPGAGAAVDFAMVPLGWLVGEWQGTGTMQTRTGSEVALVHEKVEGRLGGRVLVIEGIGREPREIAIPNGRSRYHIERDGEEWLETGEYSLDGTTWRKFFEMRLRRVPSAPQ